MTDDEQAERKQPADIRWKSEKFWRLVRQGRIRIGKQDPPDDKQKENAP